MYWEIEVNVARKGGAPNWRTLTDEHECHLVFETEADARAALDAEGRGDNARLMRFVNGIGRAVS